MVQPDVVPDVADVGARNVYLGAAQALTFHCEKKKLQWTLLNHITDNIIKWFM